MKAVYSSPHLFWVTHYQNILQHKGITGTIKNQYLSGGAGELPPNECWPILYVEEDDFDRAQQIVQEELNAENISAPPWVCESCGEENEGQFAVCWNCGTPASNEDDSASA
jgi:hypothetical protein